jgi:hypothetical protein
LDNINDLLHNQDFISIVFREHLVKSGQVTLETIMTSEQFKSDIAFHKDKLFVKLLKPLLEYCDCTIRVKDLVQLTLDFVFLAKEDVINEVREYVTIGSYELKKDDVIDGRVLLKYTKEINQNNIEKFEILLAKRDDNVDPDQLVSEIEEAMPANYPYKNQNVTIDLKTIARLLAPQWREYLLNMVTFAREHIEEKRHKRKQQIAFVERVIERYELYWSVSKSGVPDYPGLISSIMKEVYKDGDLDLPKHVIEELLVEDRNFIMFKTEIPDETLDISEKVQGKSLKVTRVDEETIEIDENESTIKVLTSQKVSVLKRLIRELLFPRVKVILDDSYRVEKYNNRVYLLFVPRFKEIIIKSINQQNYDQLVIIQKMLKMGRFAVERDHYERIVSAVAGCIQSRETAKVIKKFLAKWNDEMGFWYRLLNFLMSPWKESLMEQQIRSANSSLEKAVESFFKQAEKKFKSEGQVEESEYDPVLSAIHVIREQFKSIDIREIMNSSESRGQKVQRILGLYEDIGSTNKAVISGNEKSQQQFIEHIEAMIS